LKNSLQEELIRICEEKKRLQLQLEEANRSISKRELEINTLDKACKLSMNQNKTNNKFLGMAIIMKSLNSARANQHQIRNALRVWSNCSLFGKKMDETYHKVMIMNTRHVEARINAAYLLIGQFTKN